MSKVIPVLFLLLGLSLGLAVFRAAGQVDGGRQSPARPDEPVGDGFTYHGRLEVDGAPADGTYDFRFRLFDASTGGNQVGTTAIVEDVTVTDGLFTVILDFGPGAFVGQARWLEIAVREGNSDGAYSTLAGRQRLTPTPNAVHATEAGSVAWSGLTDVPAGFADGVDDVGLTAVTWMDVQNRPAGLDDGDDVGLTSVDWAIVENRPAGLDDGDDDTTYAAGAGLTLAGTTFSAEGSPYANVLVVAQSGGDFSSVQAALDSIGDAGADNPYLVYVAPGVYTETVTLKSYVTLEGAGEGSTIIRALGGSQSPADGNGSATLLGADYAAVRRLTVESKGMGQNFAVAIYNDGASPAMNEVAATASGALNTYSVYNISASSPRMSNMTATGSGGAANYGVFNSGSSAPTMTDVIAGAEGGSFNAAVFNATSSPLMSDVMATASGSGTNIGVDNANSAPAMKGVTARAEGGTLSYGVFNNASTPKMRNVTATASGASDTNTGVFNTASSEPAMSNVAASASGGTTSRGVYNQSSSPTMSNVTATASGGGENYGVFNYASSTTIRHSTLEGSTASVYRSAPGGGTVRVANSQLIGPVGSGLICFNNYDASLAAATCP